MLPLHNLGHIYDAEVVHSPNGDGKFPACLGVGDILRKSDWIVSRGNVNCPDCAPWDAKPEHVTHRRVIGLAELLAQKPDGRPGRHRWQWVRMVMRDYVRGSLQAADPATWTGQVHSAIGELAESTPIREAGEVFAIAYDRVAN